MAKRVGRVRTTIMQQILPVATPVIELEHRLPTPLRGAPARRWFALAVIAALAAHAGLIVCLLSRSSSATPASREVTPIELLAPPKSEPPPAKPQPAAKPPVEKPATSAPRAPSETKLDTQAVDKETHAPKAATPPAEGQPAQKEAMSPAAEPSKPEKPSDAAKPDVLAKDAEALAQAKPHPEKPKKLAKATPHARPRHARTALQQLAGTSPLPDYSFARPTKKSPVEGGTEDSRYLAIVYGMIQRHRAPIAAPGDGGSVTIVFEVDEDGNVIGLGVRRTSGYPELDAEAATAIRRASPFPPPPAGAPHSLVATIDFGDMGR